MGATLLLFSTLTSEDTKVVAHGLRSRDPEVLDGLIERYQYRLFRYLLFLTGSRETAEDLFQETWVRVLDRGRQYDGKSRFETWLFAIARHLVIDVQRRRMPRSLDALTDTAQENPRQFAPANDPSPLDLLSSRENQARVQVSLGELPAIYREVLLLRFQEDLGLEEIAAVVDAPLSTVKSRLYRGLNALRELIEGGNA